MSAANEAVVLRFFREVVDARSGDLGALFTEDCRVHRRDLPVPIEGREQLERFLLVSRATIREMVTTIDALVSSEDTVVARLRHRVTFASDFPTPFGTARAEGRTVEWVAMAWFRMQDGRIAEEWIVRDELGILAQLGVAHGQS
jgi:predicted ester cyclase